jgi:hypothetical protein
MGVSNRLWEKSLRFLVMISTDVSREIISTVFLTRRRLIEKFRGGTLRVLCNCEVLTTGFDAPRVTHIVMARPTVSRVLYEQIIGRGLRGPLFGGTETCVILDCEDNFRDERPPLGYESFRSIWDKQSCL